MYPENRELIESSFDIKFPCQSSVRFSMIILKSDNL